MRIGTRVIGTALAGALLAVGGASQAMAQAKYNASTSLSNGRLSTSISQEDKTQPDGSAFWQLQDVYEKTGGGTITAQFGFNYHGYSYNRDWSDQSVNQTKDAWFWDLGFNDCQNVIGWMAVKGQNTFYNAPVTIC
ncbi:hypothetical protein ACFXPX_41650 [Kitasatospora sp. NPDC059146]|uniref:hypothetical protein n=1 Tax=unclassified Kitasatospora TaxID=2633591 RepID=UPI0035D72BD9